MRLVCLDGDGDDGDDELLFTKGRMFERRSLHADCDVMMYTIVFQKACKGKTKEAA